MRVHKNVMGTSLRKSAVQNKGRKSEEKGFGESEERRTLKATRWCIYVQGVSHSCGLFDAMEADSCWRCGDRHGTCHTYSERVMVLPAVPSFPGSRADLLREKGKDMNI